MKSKHFWLGINTQFSLDFWIHVHISSGHGHLGDSIRDWLEWRPLGEGGANGSQVWRFSTHLRKEGPGLLIQQILVLAVALGRNGHYLLIVFGTYCVILEEIKGTRQPLVEIWALYHLLFPRPISSLPSFPLHCDDLVGTSVNKTNASSDYNLLIVVYNENCKLF